MSKCKIGVLIVLAGNFDFDGLVSFGVVMDVDIMEFLLESIFNKYSFLYDGVVIVSNGWL